MIKMTHQSNKIPVKTYLSIHFLIWNMCHNPIGKKKDIREWLEISLICVRWYKVIDSIT